MQLSPFNSQNSYETNCVFVSGQDVYVGGGLSIWNVNGGLMQAQSAKLWKNGIETTHDVPYNVMCVSVFKGHVFETVSAHSFNASSFIYRDGRQIYASDSYHERMLGHQVIQY
jgi:hypothetical protein